MVDFGRFQCNLCREGVVGGSRIAGGDRIGVAIGSIAVVGRLHLQTIPRRFGAAVVGPSPSTKQNPIQTTVGVDDLIGA